MYNSVWYDNLIKPSIQPPAWIFSPVWILLYCSLLISIIIYTVTFSEKRKLSGYVYFLLHMIFNLLWSPVLFYMHRIDFALIIVICMDILALLMIMKFLSVSKIAGLILLPYLCWIIFATYLNFQLLILN